MEDNQKKAKKVVKEKFIYGIVNAKLNFREEPNYNARILDILDAGLKIKINLTNSTDEFYSTIYHSIDGFVAKKFVDIPAKNESQDEKED